MSDERAERPMAERHEWSEDGKNFFVVAEGGGRVAAPLPSEDEAPAMLPDLVEEKHRQGAITAMVRELCRLRAELDGLSKDYGILLAESAGELKEAQAEAQRWKALAGRQREGLEYLVALAELAGGLRTDIQPREGFTFDECRAILADPDGTQAQRELEDLRREVAKAETQRDALIDGLREIAQEVNIAPILRRAGLLADPGASPDPRDWPGGVPSDPRPYFAEHPLGAGEEEHAEPRYWLVVICREGVSEVSPFLDEENARLFFESASAQWSDSFLAEVHVGPRVSDLFPPTRPREPRPIYADLDVWGGSPYTREPEEEAAALDSGVGYAGQRYEVHYVVAATGAEEVMGWCNEADGGGLLRAALKWPHVAMGSDGRRRAWVVDLHPDLCGQKKWAGASFGCEEPKGHEAEGTPHRIKNNGDVDDVVWW